MDAVFAFTLIRINVYLPCEPLIRLNSRKNSQTVMKRVDII